MFRGAGLRNDFNSFGNGTVQGNLGPNWSLPGGPPVIGPISSVPSTSTGLSSTPHDQSFVLTSLLARYQPSAPASFGQVFFGTNRDQLRSSVNKKIGTKLPEEKVPLFWVVI